MCRNILFLCLVLLSTAACDKKCEDFNLQPGDHKLSVGDWSDRDVLIHIPPDFSCTSSSPVVVAFHGGGSQKEEMPLLTCPDATAGDPKCLDELADREGFIAVYPDGTANPLVSTLRTFNANNGEGVTNIEPLGGDWTCVSGYACEHNIDDHAYFASLVSTVAKVTNFDRNRLYLTGVSNGAAMAHRIACEFADEIAAIAPVAGGNQAAALDICHPSEPVAILEIHGTDDPSWPYGSETTDGNVSGSGKGYSVPHTLAFWTDVNGCDLTPTEEALPDLDAGDGSTVTRVTYANCSADVVHYRIEGGGHTWPDGYQYDTVAKVGPTNRDINANEVMWDFFQAHPKSANP